LKPVVKDLEAWSDAAFHETVEVTFDGAPQDFSGWTEFELLGVDSYRATASLFAGAVAVDASTPGTLTLDIAQADLAACFAAGETKTVKELPYVLRVKPGVSYRIRLMYGKFTLHRGLP